MPLRIHLTAPLVVGALVLATQAISYSSGPPPGNAGAPGNNTCATAGCHNSFAVNSGDGVVGITTNIPESGFVPGETYTVTLKALDAGMSAFGFQALAYAASKPGGVGQVVLTDTDRTRTIGSGGNTYVEQNSAGSNATDSTTWSFDWVAPDKGTGDVSFYAAFVAANNNGNRQGDYVYTTNSLFPENLTASLSEIPEIAAASVYPNPVADIVSISLLINQPTEFHWKWVNIQGSVVSAGMRDLKPGEFSRSWDLSDLPAGLYVLELATNRGRWQQKVVKR